MKFFSSTRDLVVQARDLVEHLLGDGAAFRSADGLREEQHRDGLLDGGQVLRQDLFVLRGEEGHASIVGGDRTGAGRSSRRSD